MKPYWELLDAYPAASGDALELQSSGLLGLQDVK